MVSALRSTSPSRYISERGQETLQTTALVCCIKLLQSLKFLLFIRDLSQFRNLCVAIVGDYCCVTPVGDSTVFCSHTLFGLKFYTNGFKLAIFSFSSRNAKNKMVGSNGTMIAIRLVRSKLRKREEHSNSVHPTDVVLQTGPAQPPAPPQPLATTADPLPYRGQPLWQFPPPPSQHLYCNNNQETLVHTLQMERPGIVQGFRKNLGGRWRRLVKKKPENEVYTIPPELRPQLKTIYVY
ncbi:uncharacterized protein LOC116167281 isoform X1 [Photinus pyralis]|nr:uncharacterized protein LOC116167281 isoform X1 [Photinus pyralis]